MTDDIGISAFAAEDLRENLGELGGLLNACVHGGASISFVLPHSQADSEAFWLDKVLPGVADGTRLLLVAKKGGRIAGSVQLNGDMPPNQPHRAEVNKLLVHPDFRRSGIGRRLMAELEQRAAAAGRSLITLDTRSGDKAEPLYAGLGYRTVGIIPGFARDPMGGERLDPTTIMYKTL
ncbi:GNAT family N-acetyltransferase [Aminobacter sp. Piv2-1]|uniref:GNAT family N-acetyltransferase n=1 Tax=Aminobacter sp. Piv2-1 TaxID=3031122 RepID=UPI0030A75001